MDIGNLGAVAWSPEGLSVVYFPFRVLTPNSGKILCQIIRQVTPNGISLA